MATPDVSTSLFSPKSHEGRKSYVARPIPTPGMTLSEAARIWLEPRKDQRKPKTIECNESEIRKLLKFFGEIRLSEFHIGHFEHYQQACKEERGHSAINHELNLLSRLLEAADLWDPIKKHYVPFKEPDWTPPKMFSVQEQVRIFDKLKADPELELAEIVFTITRNTTASGCELRGLRLKHLELDAVPPRVHIPPDATKNNVRPRTIPLNEEAVNAFRRAVDRAQKLGCHYPEQFLFPFREKKNLWDPYRPASKSWLRKQTEKMREATGIQHLRPHAFRHLAVTELLEKGAPEQTVIALAGWVSRRMIDTYSHTRIEAKADAVELLGPHAKAKTFAQATQQAFVEREQKVMEAAWRDAQEALGVNTPKAPEATKTFDVTDPAIQEEIARQVALALQSMAASQEIPVAAKGPRLLKFPHAK